MATKSHDSSLQTLELIAYHRNFHSIHYLRHIIHHSSFNTFIVSWTIRGVFALLALLVVCIRYSPLLPLLRQTALPVKCCSSILLGFASQGICQRKLTPAARPRRTTFPFCFPRGLRNSHTVITLSRHCFSEAVIHRTLLFVPLDANTRLELSGVTPRLIIDLAFITSPEGTSLQGS